MYLKIIVETYSFVLLSTYVNTYVVGTHAYFGTVWPAPFVSMLYELECWRWISNTCLLGFYLIEKLKLSMELSLDCREVREPLWCLLKVVHNEGCMARTYCYDTAQTRRCLHYMMLMSIQTLPRQPPFPAILEHLVPLLHLDFWKGIIFEVLLD